MPRTAQQNERLRADSKRRLLDAARLTFVRLGFERATIRDIAQEAGAAQGLLYNYFRTKDDLLRAVFVEGTHDVGAAFRAGAEGNTPDERLERMIRRSFEILRERRDFWQLSYMLRFQPRTADVLGDALGEWTAGVRSHLEALLRGVGHRNARTLSRVLFGAIDGVAQHYVLEPDDYPLEATAECLVRLFGRPSSAPASTQGVARKAGESPRRSRSARPRQRPGRDSQP